jgi:hypothetical protein
VAKPVSKLGWKIVAGAVAAAAGTITSKAAAGLYQKVRKSEPPGNPLDPDTTWGEAIGWAVFSGVAIGVGRLAAQRVDAGAWLRATGSLPPGIEKSA